RNLASQRTIVLPDTTLASVTAGRWTAADGIAPDSLLRATLTARRGRSFVTAAQIGSMIYAPATTSGGVSISTDDGATWTDSAIAGASAVDRFWVDPGNPLAALAAAGTKLYRTTN